MHHTFSAGAVVINPRGLVLVVNQNGTSWSLPKGHLEDGEDAKTAATREVTEESGVTQLEFMADLGSYDRYRIGRNGSEDRSELKTITLFLYRTGQEELEPIDPQNPEARWVNPDQVADRLTHPRDQAFYRTALPSIKRIIHETRS